MPKRDRLADRHALDGDRHLGPVAAMEGDERLVVHLVDVVAGEHQHDVAGLLLDHLEVRQHRVGRAAVPLGRAAARDVRLQQPDAALGSVEVPRPADADVVVQRVRVVLRQDEHVVDLGVDAVRQREVDDPVLAGKRNGGLGADGRKDRQPLTLSSGEHDCDDPLHAADATSGRTARRTSPAAHRRGAPPSQAPTPPETASPRSPRPWSRSGRPPRAAPREVVAADSAKLAVEDDREVEVRPGRLAGHVHLADQLALADARALGDAADGFARRCAYIVLMPVAVVDDDHPVGIRCGSTDPSRPAR